MTNENKIIKLNASTVRELKCLMKRTGKTTMDTLLKSMITITSNYYEDLKNIGWKKKKNPSKREKISYLQV